MTDNIACKYARTNVSEVNGIAETWLLEHVTTECTNARIDLDTVRLELQHMMDGNHMTSTARAKRIAPLLAAGVHYWYQTQLWFTWYLRSMSEIGSRKQIKHKEVNYGNKSYTRHSNGN